MHNAKNVIDLCSNNGFNSDSNTPLCQVDSTDVNPTAHQMYNAMVVDLVATFDDAKAQHDNADDAYLGDSDTPIFNTNDTITDASLDLANGTIDSNEASNNDILDEAHPAMQISKTDD